MQDYLVFGTRHESSWGNPNADRYCPDPILPSLRIALPSTLKAWRSCGVRRDKLPASFRACSAGGTLIVNGDDRDLLQEVARLAAIASPLAFIGERNMGVETQIRLERGSFHD